jgi:hypothetical protein
MIRSAILLAFCAGPVLADYPAEIKHLGTYSQDSLEIVSAAADRATVRYYNHVDQKSKSGTYTLQIGAIVVDVEIIIGGAEVDRREIMIVRPRGDFVAIPDRVEAADGETVTALVVLPMF